MIDLQGGLLTGGDVRHHLMWKMTTIVTGPIEAGKGLPSVCCGVLALIFW